MDAGVCGLAAIVLVIASWLMHRYLAPLGARMDRESVDSMPGFDGHSWSIFAVGPVEAAAGRVISGRTEWRHASCAS